MKKLKFTKSQGVIKSYLLHSLLFTIFFLFDNYGNIHAQDMISLYREFLPNSVLKNIELREAINARLEGKARIHPELLYYNILQVRNLYEKKIKSEVMNNYVYQIQKNFVAKRNSFVNNQLLLLNKNYQHEYLRGKCIPYLIEFLSDSLGEVHETINPIEVDSNLIDYCVYKYISKDTTLTYDSKIVYKVKRDETQKSVFKHFCDYLININNNLEIKSSEILKALRDNWFVFEDAIELDDDNEKCPELYSIIIRLVEHDYETRNLSKFTIGVGYCFANSTYTASQDVPVTYKTYPHYSGQPNVYKQPVLDLKLSSPQFIGTLGYRMYVREYFDYLSYVNFQFMVSIGAGSSSYKKTNKVDKVTKANNVSIIHYENFIIERYIDEYNSFVAKTSAPIFVFGSNLTFEIALNAVYLYYSTTSNYNFKMTINESFSSGSMWDPKTVTNPVATGSGQGKLGKSESKLIIYPTLDICYDINKQVRATASCSYNYCALYSSVSFSIFE